MLELEPLSLDGEPTPSPAATEKIGPWRTIDAPIDFIINQLRIVPIHSMFERYLSMEE